MEENMEEHVEMQPLFGKKDTDTTSISIVASEKTDHEPTNTTTDNISGKLQPACSTEHPNEGTIFCYFSSEDTITI